MQIETLSVTRLTIVLPIRTTLSQGRIRFRLMVERIIDLVPRTPKATYRLSFCTHHVTEALETHSSCDHLGWPTDQFSLSGRVYDLLATSGGNDEPNALAVRMVLEELQQSAVQGDFPAETRRILLALWEGINASPATA